MRCTGSRFEAAGTSGVKSGRYSSPSEVIREALRLLEDQKQRHRKQVEEFTQAIRAGAESGDSAPLDMDEAIAEAEERAGYRRA